MAKTSFMPAGTFHVSETQQERLRRALESGAEAIVEQPDGRRVSSRELSLRSQYFGTCEGSVSAGSRTSSPKRST